jgi:hypothetical protein
LLELRLTWFFLRKREVGVFIFAVFGQFSVVVLSTVAVLAFSQLCA